jgi:hypothetical protein
MRKNINAQMKTRLRNTSIQFLLLLVGFMKMANGCCSHKFIANNTSLVPAKIRISLIQKPRVTL